MTEEIKAPGAKPASGAVTAPKVDTGGTATINERLADEKVKRAQDATNKVEKENRLPESGAVTNPAPATAADMVPGGAFIEPEIRDAIPVNHPAIDNNPRAGTSAVQNGADFNDPYHRHPSDPDFAGQGIDRSVYGKIKSK